MGMNPLSRMRLASQLSRAGAWATLVLGFILVILFYVLNNPVGGQGGDPGLVVFIFVELIIVMLTLFLFLVLYSFGALLNYMSASKSTPTEGVTPAKVRHQTEEEEGIQLEITPLQKE